MSRLQTNYIILIISSLTITAPIIPVFYLSYLRSLACFEFTSRLLPLRNTASSSPPFRPSSSRLLSPGKLLCYFQYSLKTLCDVMGYQCIKSTFPNSNPDDYDVMRDCVTQLPVIAYNLRTSPQEIHLMAR